MFEPQGPGGSLMHIEVETNLEARPMARVYDEIKLENHEQNAWAAQQLRLAPDTVAAHHGGGRGDTQTRKRGHGDE